MMKISAMKIGDVVEATLVVTSATARETKNKKPYLQLELYDGIDKITGNYWDWRGQNVPEINSILDVTGQITEYLGQKQFNIKGIARNTTRHLSEFAPDSGVDIPEAFKEAYDLAMSIQDDFLRNVTLHIFELLQSNLLVAPGAKGVHHAFIGGTLVHSLSVAKIAKGIVEQVPDANLDLCIAGALLHDVGKVFTYDIDGITIKMTNEGQLFDHTFIGARLISFVTDDFVTGPSDEFKAMLLTHIVLSHHGKLEYGAAVPPQCIEAYIVSHADGIDAEAQQIRESSRKVGKSAWTDKIYTLNNRPHITPQFIDEALFSKD